MLAIEQGLFRRNPLNCTAEIPCVTDARQRACGNRRQPGAVDAAHGGQRVHPAPIPSNRLSSLCGGRQARRAGPEFFGPAGAATGWCHRRKIDSRQTRRRGQGIQADGAAVDGKPMRKVSVTNWSGTKPAQQRRQAQAVELRNAQQPRAQKLIGCRLRNEGQADVSCRRS